MGRIVDKLNLFLSGVGLGTCLLIIGALLGYRTGKRRAISSGQGFDRGGILHLLRELGTWTNEYAGNVSQYQDRLGEISRAVEGKSLEGKSLEGPVIADVPALLGEIMRSNQELKKRLDLAENQLEKQTRQLESYLSEARTDALTGLANRRALDQKLEQMLLARQKGSGASFVMMLIDVDHFKRINDEYGHPAGDEVLRQIARTISNELHGAYIVARFGGEEFAALLPSPLRLAADRSNKMRQVISHQRIATGKRSLAVTVSVGLSEVQGEKSTGTLVRRADEALYAAKGMGRNRVYYHDGVQPVLHGAPEVVKDA